MENTNTFLLVLLMMTLFAGVGVGIYQYLRVQRSKRLNTHSAATKGTSYES
jgi:hypothetical protein